MNEIAPDERKRNPLGRNAADLAAHRLSSHKLIILELINVLLPHRGGLRRWSVMRAIRRDRERLSRDIPHKFEDDVERTFRQFCATTSVKPEGPSESTILFFRPAEKAGEVWAVFPHSATAWLAHYNNDLLSPRETA